MGQGIQPPPVQPTSVGTAFVDVFKVLFEPAAVFARVRGWPSFVIPFLTICAVQLILFVVNLSYFKIGIQAQMAARGQTGQAPMGIIIGVSLFFLILVFAVIFLFSGLLLWVLVSVMGGDAKFGTLLGVASYAAVPAALLLGIVGTIVLHLQGPSGITSPQDMQPALGLDLLVPGAKGFTGAVLKAINPFSLWGLVLTAIGVTVTHRLTKGTAYTVATIAFVVGLLIAGVFGALGSRGS
jgi:hypothetical protein